MAPHLQTFLEMKRLNLLSNWIRFYLSLLLTVLTAMAVFLYPSLGVTGVAPTTPGSEIKKLILVSDIDDTIQDTQIRAGSKTLKSRLQHYFHLVRNFFKSHDAFIGLPGTYMALASNGIEVHYVSGAPKLISGVPEKFLQSSGFPTGSLWVRPSLEVSTEDFKVHQISQLIEQNPDAMFILVGDNGEKDVTVYDRVRSRYPSQLAGAYIHRLFPEGIGESLKERQSSFLTGADLAVQFHNQGWLSPSQTKEILRNVERGLGSNFYSIRRRALPYFVRTNHEELNGFYEQAQQIQDNSLRDIYINTLKHISPRNEGPQLCQKVFSTK